MKITAKNLIKIYNDRTVVNDISFEVNKGEVVGLLGPNGAGKTTTFYMVVGLVKPNGGQVFLGDTELTNVPMNVRAKAGIGYLPQEASIFRKLSVEDNIKLVLQMNDKLNEEEKAAKLEDLLDEFGMQSAESLLPCHFPVAKDAVLSWRGRLRQVRNLFFLMSRSRGLTRLLSAKLKTISGNYPKKRGWAFLLPTTTPKLRFQSRTGLM